MQRRRKSRPALFAVALLQLLLLCGGGGEAISVPGDELLAQAFDAALLELVSEGEIAKILDANGVAPTRYLQDCSPTTTYFAYPSVDVAANATALAMVLNSGRFRVTSRRLSKGAQGDYTVDPPTGVSPDIERAVAQRIGQHYGYPLIAKFELDYESSEDAINGVSSGNGEMATTLTGIGGFYASTRRNVEWRAGCAAVSDAVALVVKAGLGITTFEEFKLYVSRSPMPQIGTVGTSEMQLMQQVFPDATVIQYLTSEEALERLEDGSLLAIGGVLTEDEVTENQTVLPTGFVLPRSGFFRREIPTSLKVKNLDDFPAWSIGNEQLALTYEAAINGLVQLDTISKIFSRYQVENVLVADCYASSSAYRVPATAVGTLLNVTSGGKLVIGALFGDYLPLWAHDGTTAKDSAIYELEKKIVEWMGKLTGRSISVEYKVFQQQSDIITALNDGSIHMTSSFFFKGGFLQGIATRQRLRATCTTAATEMAIAVLHNSTITNISTLIEATTDPTKGFGAVTQNAEAMLLQISRYRDSPVIFQRNTDALDALLSHQVDAVMLAYTTGIPMRYNSTIKTWKVGQIMPYCAFFRKDRTKSCGDGVLDTTLDEVCEISGLGCNSTCGCGEGFANYTPARLYCYSLPPEPKNVTAVVLAVIGSILALVAVVALVFAFAFWRRRKSPGFSPLRSSLQSPLQMVSADMEEYLPGDLSLGLRVTPSVLSFGTNTMQLPVDQDVDDKLVITGMAREPTKFVLEFPSIPPYKCKLTSSMSSGEVRRGQELTITITLRMLCTTMLDIPLLVVVPEKGYSNVRISVESQLSTRLDPDEVTTGSIIGVGSFGTVFRGEWRGIECAVKAYNETALVDIGLRTDIEREVEMCFKLRMPYIVTFYGRTVSFNKMCIVMEYVKYGSLGAMLQKPDPIPMRFKVRVALDVAKGMNFLHKNRVIHRDLKSDNVLISCMDPEAPVCAKLSDFNTSRFWGSDANRTKTKGVGTPIYMAPEILDGKHYSWMADVYSYSILLWTLFTQKEPYSDFESSFVFFMFVLEGNRMKIPEDLPPPLAALIADCWRHIPEERPTFQAIVQRLDELLPTITI